MAEAPPPNTDFTDIQRQLIAKIPRVTNKDNYQALVATTAAGRDGYDGTFERLVQAIIDSTAAPPVNYGPATARLIALNTNLRAKIEYIQRRFAYYYSVEGLVPDLLDKLDSAKILFEQAILRLAAVQGQPADLDAFNAAVTQLEGVAGLIDAIDQAHLEGPGTPDHPGPYPRGNPGGGPNGDGGGGGPGGDGGGGGAVAANPLADGGAAAVIPRRGQLPARGPGQNIQGAPAGRVGELVQQFNGQQGLDDLQGDNAVEMQDMGARGRGVGPVVGVGGRKRKSKRASKRKMKKTNTKKSRKGSRKQRGGFRYVTKPKTKKHSASSSSSSSSSTMSSSARN